MAKDIPGNTPYSPHARLCRLDHAAARWTGGFWKQKVDMVRDHSLQSVLEALEDPTNATYFGNFRAVADGGTFHGVFWSDGDCYKVMETMALVFDLTGDAALESRLDEMIAEVAGAQEPDGYLGTQITLTDLSRWEDIEHHEIYNMGHLLTAAVTHHQITGKLNFLDIAIRTADFLYRTFTTRDPALARFGFNPSQIMGLVELFRETGEVRYLELANIFVSNRGTHPEVPGGTLDQQQNRVPLRDETEAVGHAVTGPYLWGGAADIVMETDEVALRDAVTRIWEDSTFRKMYITGGIGSLHKGASERSADLFEPISEAYGRPFQLPSDYAYNETCANIANAMWSWRMLQLTGDARYADVMERVLHNSALSAVSLSGTHFTYSNPLRFNGEDQLMIQNDSPRRWTRFGCYCCPPQVTRTIAGLHRWTYSTGNDTLWVHLYGENRIDTETPSGRISLAQSSNYPWSGDIRFEIEAAPETPFTLNLRLPGWCDGSAVKVNGTPIAYTHEPATYLPVTREWKPGDVVELSLAMEPRLMAAHPAVEETRNQVAVTCGPLVYCVEGIDLPEGVSIDGFALSPDAPLTLKPGQGIFDGMVLLEARASRRREWGAAPLYAPLAVPSAETLTVSLIPYFAWNNREPTTMAVWLPLAA